MAQVDYFLKVDGVEGESPDAKLSGQIPLLSWSWGETNSGSESVGLGGGAGKVHMQDIHFTTQMGKHSVKLFLACASGQHIKKATLTCRKAGKDQQPFLVVNLAECFISSYQTGGSSGDALIPIDQFSINFAEIKFEYKEQKDDGTLGGVVPGGWNQKKNTAVA